MNTEEHSKHTRRGFLDTVLAVCSLVAGVAMAAPGLLYLWPAARGSGGGRVEVADAQKMSTGQSRTIQLEGKAVIVVRGRSDYRAFSAACTHLGCLVKWDMDRKVFVCPCHAAVFDENGLVISGPPPLPLPSYKVTEIGAKVYVSAS